MKTLDYNDINLDKWENYSDIRVDSFWNNEVNLYEQLLKRYTKENDTILNLYCYDKETGPINENDAVYNESLKLNRTCIKAEDYRYNKEQIQEIKKVLKPKKKFQFIVINPELTKTLAYFEPETFYKDFTKTIKNYLKILEDERFIALVVGNTYSNGEMQLDNYKYVEALKKQGLRWCSMIIHESKPYKKDGLIDNLFRYRALHSGYNMPNYCMVFIFQKTKGEKCL